MTPRDRWTQPEDALVRDRYPHVGPEGTRIALALAGYTRATASVRARASALSIRKRPIGDRHANAEPGTGARPDPNYQYAYPIRFSDVFVYHPQLADALCGTLRDDWRAINPDEVTQ